MHNSDTEVLGPPSIVGPRAKPSRDTGKLPCKSFKGGWQGSTGAVTVFPAKLKGGGEVIEKPIDNFDGVP